MTTFLRTSLKVFAGALALGAATLLSPSDASAQWGGYGGGYGGYGGYGQNYGSYGGGYGGYSSNYGFNNYGYGPVYDPPSVHYDAVPHTTGHWTPWRGYHTHTHIDMVPHYVPGHFDRAHGNHIDANPYFHNH
jgi:hypothetical protein